MTEKECTKCFTIKPLDEFGVMPRGKFGKRASCKACQYVMFKERVAKNPEKRRETEKNYRKRNPEVFARRDKKYYEKNKERHLQNGKNWKKNNPEKYAELNRRKEHVRRARKLNNGIEPYTEAQMLEAYGELCHLCEKQIDLTAPRKVGIDGWEQGLQIDHVVPISKGGSDTLENVRPAHGICNIKKGNVLKYLCSAFSFAFVVCEQRNRPVEITTGRFSF